MTRIEIDSFRKKTLEFRFAYSMKCLNEALRHFGYELENWETVLKMLSSFKDDMYILDWQDSVIEIMPNVVMSGGSECYKTDLRSTYESAHPVVIEIIYIVHGIGTSELFGGNVEDGIVSLHLIDELQELMDKNKIPIPQFQE